MSEGLDGITVRLAKWGWAGQHSWQAEQNSSGTGREFPASLPSGRSESMYSPNPKTALQAPTDIDGPLLVPELYLRRVRHNLSVQKRLLEQRTHFKEVSPKHPDHAGRQTEQEFYDILRELIPDDFKIVIRGRLLTDDLKDSPELDLMVLKPGGEKRLNGQDYYPRESVLAAFECKLTLRKADLVKAAVTANKIKGEYARGCASKEGGESEIYPTCKPYYGILALSWEGGDGPESVKDLVRLLSTNFESCQLGRQVDCVLVPSISFCSIVHEPDPFVPGLIELGIRYEPSLAMYEWPEGELRPCPPHDHPALSTCAPASYEKHDHHNSLMGLGNFLAHMVHEHKGGYDFLIQDYAYYGHLRGCFLRPYKGLKVAA